MDACVRARGAWQLARLSRVQIVFCPSAPLPLQCLPLCPSVAPSSLSLIDKTTMFCPSPSLSLIDDCVLPPPSPSLTFSHRLRNLRPCHRRRGVAIAPLPAIVVAIVPLPTIVVAIVPLSAIVVAIRHDLPAIIAAIYHSPQPATSDLLPIAPPVAPLPVIAISIAGLPLAPTHLLPITPAVAPLPTIAVACLFFFARSWLLPVSYHRHHPCAGHGCAPTCEFFFPITPLLLCCLPPLLLTIATACLSPLLCFAHSDFTT